MTQDGGFQRTAEINMSHVWDNGALSHPEYAFNKCKQQTIVQDNLYHIVLMNSWAAF